MRTTLNLDDNLLISAKHRAIEESVSLARVIENALRESLAKPRVKRDVIRCRRNARWTNRRAISGITSTSRITVSVVAPTGSKANHQKADLPRRASSSRHRKWTAQAQWRSRTPPISSPHAKVPFGNLLE